MNPIIAANDVLMRFWDLTLPVDPIAIAGGMGIKVFYSNDLGELSGFYDDEEKEIYSIKMNLRSASASRLRMNSVMLC